MRRANRCWWFILTELLVPFLAQAQIDTEKRELIQGAFNQAIQGQQPLAGYGFFYYNKPGFLQTNLTLRLAVAPVYADSELGFSHLLGPHTDFAVGLAGGGYGDSYIDFDRGVYRRAESFWGDGGEVSASVYHLFDPNKKVPLYLVFRSTVHESLYRRDSRTASDFILPEDRTTFRFRTGLRFGGQEPSLTEPMAMELSVWHEAQVRAEHEKYGFNGDREVRPESQLLWGRALLKFMFEPSEQWIDVIMTAGSVWDADRFSAYRMGGLLPFTSEFPLNIPGYFYQELSVRHFGLVNAQYSLPLPMAKSWRFEVLGAGGWVDYLPELAQPGHWHAGLAGGISYISPKGSWFVSLLYGHGFEAIRSHGHGADQVAALFQYDFQAKGRGKSRFFVPGLNPYHSGAEQIFR